MGKFLDRLKGMISGIGDSSPGGMRERVGTISDSAPGMTGQAIGEAVFDGLNPLGYVRRAESPSIRYDPRYDRPRASAPDMSAGPMPLIGRRENRYNREEVPVAQKILADSDESGSGVAGTQSHVPEGASAMADSGGSINAFIASISGQGLSTTQILQRARARGIDADAVLKELTKPRYDPAQFRTPQPGTAGLAPRFSDGSVAEPNAIDTRRPNTMPFPGTNPMGGGPPAMSALPRPRVSYVAGRHIPTAGPAEGTFPDMVRMPQMGTVEMANPMAVNDAEAAHFQQGPFAAPSPPAMAMQAMLADAASRPTGMSAAPVDIRRSDVMIGSPRPVSPMMARRRAMFG